LRGKRRRGGQFGHRQHLRPSFPPDQVDHLPPIFEWTGEPLGPEWIATDELRTIQQVELAEKLVEVTEHRARWYRSSATGEVIASPFPEDVLRLDISRGQLAKVVQKGSAALGACYAQLQAVLPQQRTLNVDETDAVMQFCWAHLVRDVKFLTTLSDPVTARFGAKLLAAIKVLFRVWHRRSAEPTNNAMERGFRHLVIDRKVTQGTRGEPGRRWCERIWTVLATCAQQGRSAFQFIYQSITAYFNDHSFLSLLPQVLVPLTTHGGRSRWRGGDGFHPAPTTKDSRDARPWSTNPANRSMAVAV